MLSGSAGIAAGFLTFFYPVVTAYALLYIMAAWAIISGVFEIVAAIEFRRALSDMWLLGLAGALSIALGILLAAAPGAGLLSLVWLLGGYGWSSASCTSSPASASRVYSRRSVRHVANAERWCRASRAGQEGARMTTPSRPAARMLLIL